MPESIITLGIGGTPVSLTPFITSGLFVKYPPPGYAVGSIALVGGGAGTIALSGGASGSASLVGSATGSLEGAE